MKASIASWVAVFSISAAAYGQSRDAGAPATTNVTPAAVPGIAGPASPQPPNGFMMINGTLYECRNGQLQAVTRELTLRISPNGVVTGFDGRAYTIPTGVLLTVEARGVPLSGTPLAAAAGNGPAGATANGTPANPPPTSTTIYTGTEIGSFSIGTTTFVPTTVVVPGVITVPSVLPTAPMMTGAAPSAPPTNRGQPVTNNPFSGAAPAAFGVNTTATGNQQNTLGTQQIRPGMGNAVGTGGGPPRR